MPVVFKRRSELGVESGNLNIGRLTTSGSLTKSEIDRLSKIREAWNFYEGFHWEDIDDEDSPQVTYNYCRAFVNKFVAFEFGKGFTIKTSDGLDDISVSVHDDKIDTKIDKNQDGVITEKELKDSSIHLVGRTVYDFLDQVWQQNDKETFCEELGQTKSITGDAWVKVQFIAPEDLEDPFEEFPNGKIKLMIVPTQYVFPEFNQHDKDKLENVLIMYPIERRVNKGILRKRSEVETSIYKEYWTSSEVIIFEDDREIDRMENPYGIIPFVQIKNFPIAGRTYGFSDLEDIIPLNVEFNIKKSDMSEIIDYHSAPITLVYGAKIGNLEKGANKVWGGLPKDGKVENLSLTGDLIASKTYTDDLKTAMCEIGSMPETVLGGTKAISNTSGVALQYMNGPLIDKTKIKRHSTERGLAHVNKLILYIGLLEGLIEKPDKVSMKDFLHNTVTLPDTLPKDTLIELQAIQSELQMGLECRHGAMERLGKENIPSKIEEIDKEREEHPELFNPSLQQAWYSNKSQSQQINSGMTNGQTPVEEVRKEITGQNGAGNIT